jgi:ATP-binding cassette, subfamily B, bacterial
VTSTGTGGGWSLLRRTLAEQTRGLTIGVLVGLGWTLGKVTVPLLVRQAIDRSVEGDEDPLLMWVVLLLAVGAVVGVFAALRRFMAFREARWTETRLRERLFEHLQRLHVGYHDRSQTGQLMSRANTDLQQVMGFVVMIPLVISNVAMVLAVVVVLFLIDPTLALVALAPLPFINILATRFSRRIHPAVMAVQQESAQLATVVEETVSGVRVIKGFGAESVQQAKLQVEAEDVREASLASARVRSTYMPLMDLLPSLGLIAVLGIGGQRVLADDMTIGDLVAFNTYVTLLVWPLRTIGMTVAFGQRAAAALVRIDEVLSTEPAVTSPASPHRLPARPAPASGIRHAGPSVGAVRFRDVTFGYDTGSPVLAGFDLDIPAGASVAVVGATGAGKSTIARLLSRFYDVRSGVVELDGIDLRTIELSELRRAVGVVFEDTFLFTESVAANIAFARPDAPQELVEHAARLAGAHDFVLDLPDGYETVLGERGYSLSGGQRQRIAIARAILSDPRVLVLDDATSAVDPSKEHEIRDALAAVMRDRTTIVIAHRPATIALAETVVLLDAGRVGALGTHDELLATSERYRAVLAALAHRDSERAEQRDVTSAGTLGAGLVS